MNTRHIVTAISLFALFSLSVVTSAQVLRGPITGEWRIEFTRQNPDEVQLTMLSGNPGKSQSNWGNGIPISEIQGLSRDVAKTSSVDVNLRIVRDAGTFDLVGSFRDGKGSGRYTLTPNEGFFAALSTRGYANLPDRDVFSAAMSGLKISAIDDLRAAGYDRLTFNNLIESALFKVTPQVIADLTAAGFDHLPFSKLVEAQIFKVDGAYAREVEAMGFGKLPFNKLVEMRVHKITPEYVDEVRQMGFSNLTLSRLVELKIFQVTPEFVSEVRSAGYVAVTPQQLVNMRIFKVDGDFIRRAQSENPKVTIEQMVDMRIHGRSSSRMVQ